MRLPIESKYYERKGFTPYFFAHVVFNLVRQQFAFLRNLEDWFGDVYAANWCDPFPRHTNLHQFIYNVVDSILFEDPIGENDNPALQEFCKRYSIDTSELDWDDEDSLHEMRLWADYDVAMLALSEEIFHVLFHDVVFCSDFNRMIANYIVSYGKSIGREDDRFTKQGTLKRVSVPVFVKDAIYHRDKGECRSCKVRLDRNVNLTDKEFYDHIVPLAQGGTNDLTNLQLLCFTCNSTKGAHLVAVSNLYPAAFS